MGKIIDVLNKIATNRKEKVVNKVLNSSAWVLLLQWLITNWITIFIVIVMGIWGLRGYKRLKDTETLMLQQQISTLNIDLEKSKQEKAKLLARVNDLDKLRKVSKEETDKVRKQVEKLSASDKKKKLLEYKNRLLKEKGYE
jgi:hypothetical protein